MTQWAVYLCTTYFTYLVNFAGNLRQQLNSNYTILHRALDKESRYTYKTNKNAELTFNYFKGCRLCILL